MMHPYRVKELMWAVIILLFIMIAALTGCSSAPTQMTARQYCHTSQEIRSKDGSRVSSETLVKCNDDPVERVVIKQAGIASNCKEYTYWVTLNNLPVQQRGMACEKFNGAWEILPNYTYN